MHLLVVTTSFPNRVNPTSGIFIHRMLARLPDSVEITVLTPDGTLPLLPATADDRIRMIPIRYAPRSWQIMAHQPGGIPGVVRSRPWCVVLVPLLAAAMLIAIVRAARHADLVHAQWSFCGLLAGIGGRLRGVPVVTTLRGSDVTWARQSPFFRWLLRVCAQLSSRLTTVSRAMAEEVDSWIATPHTPIRAIANGIEECFLWVEPIPTEIFTVVSIGNLIPGKGVDLVLRAFGRLAQVDSGARLDVIGDGPQRSRLETMVREWGLAGGVRFHGGLSPAAIAGRLARSHVLVSASYSEGRPNVVAEAMAAGVAVVAADIPGVRELVAHGRTGMLFPPGDVDRLVQCLKRLQRDRAYCQRLAAAARGEVRDRAMTWTRTAREYAALYRAILAEWRKGSTSCAA